MQAREMIVNGTKYRSKGFTQDYMHACRIAEGKEEISYGRTVSKEDLHIVFGMTPQPTWWFFVKEG